MQRYQVFVNDHLILLTENKKSVDDDFKFNQLEFKSLLNVEDAGVNEAVLMVEELLKEQSEGLQVNLFTSDLNSLWNGFKKHFKIIEAAGGFVTNEKEELLMIYRLDKWDLPKGKIEVGEEIESAARREVMEECGVEYLQLNERLDPTYHIYEHKERLVLKKTYWFNMFSRANSSLSPQLEEDILKVEWKSKEEVKTLLNQTYLSLIEMLSLGLNRLK